MFSRRWLINYLLIVLIIIFTWIGHKYPVEQDQLDPDTITQLKPQDIDSIRIETADITIQLQKQGGRWQLTQPLAWLANNIAAERLTTLANTPFSSNLEKDQIDLSTLGLRIPKAVVSLNQQAIYFGDVNRIGNRRYLLVDPMIYLVDDVHYAFINQGVSGLVDKRLLPPALELQSLQFPGFQLQREQAGWTATGQDVAVEQISGLVANWQQTEARDIRAYDKALTPLSKVRVKLQDQNELEFYLLSIKPEIILARPDLNLQYHFPEQLYYDLLSLDPAPE
ncbi:MAG: DUF4340 domain-containing protein [Gammaproteobacteria bacterium]|nr:DUF4340 domain-containing protein [Gammaproteobacteria bacterium]